MREAGAPVVGWRYWRVTGDGLLRSIIQTRVNWPPDRPLKSACPGSGHAGPLDWCHCGIYAAADLTTLANRGLCLAPEPLVVGEVDLWGRVISDDGENRGEWARPVSLSVVRETVPDGVAGRLAAGLAKTYGIPASETALADVVGEVSAAVMAFQAMSSRTAR